MHDIVKQEAFLAEWSKALDLSSSIRKNAQVRTLLKALFVLMSPRGLMDKA